MIVFSKGPILPSALVLGSSVQLAGITTTLNLVKKAVLSRTQLIKYTSKMTGHIRNIRPAPAEIEYRNMRFLITDQPQDGTMESYIKLLLEHKVSHLVCATDQQYTTDTLSQSGVSVSELSFPDGSAPTSEIVDRWLALVNSEFIGDPNTCVGVHCVTGLGRAPVLVATALIELGMKYEDAVELIRKKRRGAINTKQLEFLAKYKRRKYFIKGKNKCQIQ